MDIFDIIDDDSTLDGEQAIYDKHDEDVFSLTVRILLLILLLIKVSALNPQNIASRKLHLLSREATAHVSFSNTRSNSKTSKLMLITVSTSERMMISV